MRRYALVALSLMFTTACAGSAATPTAPTALTQTPAAPLTSLSGTWIGTSADTTGRESMTWALTQNGNSMTGTMNISDTSRSMMGNGSMQGAISGSTVSFHMTVPSGGFSGTMSSCSMLVDGQGQMSDDGHALTGTYSGSMSGMMSGMMSTVSCGGAMNSGQFTLTR
ncbi:MAG: hypothetical protein NTV05_15415 [Acidobacteria bacterium]|nr:hypothetical protein [Acidobacteriota bacterium]